MKKTILLLVILALLVPAAALAQTEFTLGGFVKLDSFWDSTQENKNMTVPIQRNNNPDFHHGRMKFTAQGSRFNLTIKGPKLWGATTTGFFEIDFDSANDPVLNASNSFIPRMRHAMFRMNWPETELLLGQYWSMFCEYFAESAQDGGLQNHGIPTHRLAQIRLTQKFMDCWTVAFLVGEPTSVSSANVGVGLNNNALPGGNILQNHNLQTNGEAAESPHVQGKVAYEADLWGKAAFYGRPRGFVAQLVGGWQRTEARNAAQQAFAALTWGENNFNAVAIRQKDHQMLNNWMAQATTFIPVIPTYSANLAGTASFTAQWYIGQGLEAFGESTGNANLFFKFSGIGIDTAGIFRQFWSIQTEKRYGGYLQAQYYFTNQWFANVVFGMSKAFGVTQSNDFGAIQAGNPQGRTFASLQDPMKMQWELDLTLWYRPIQAIKFGLQYSYGRTDWFQRTTVTTSGVPIQAPTAVVPVGAGRTTDTGEAHRVEFVGFLYF